MSDGLTDRRSDTEYRCGFCGHIGYYEDFYSHGKKRPMCKKCHEHSTPEIDYIVAKAEGLKFDTGKLQFSLIPPEIKLYLAEILTFGAKKYAPDNWKKIDVQRYYDAFERHMNAFQLGEENDEESGMHHLKHALTNMMFICYLTCVKNGDK